MLGQVRPRYCKFHQVMSGHVRLGYAMLGHVMSGSSQVRLR